MLDYGSFFSLGFKYRPLRAHLSAFPQLFNEQSDRSPPPFVTYSSFLRKCAYIRRPGLCSILLMCSRRIVWISFFSASPSREPGTRYTVTTRLTLYLETRPNAYRLATPVSSKTASPPFASNFIMSKCEYHICVSVNMFAKAGNSAKLAINKTYLRTAATFVWIWKFKVTLALPFQFCDDAKTAKETRRYW